MSIKIKQTQAELRNKRMLLLTYIKDKKPIPEELIEKILDLRGRLSTP